MGNLRARLEEFFAQGLYYCKPVSVPVVVKWLRYSSCIVCF